MQSNLKFRLIFSVAVLTTNFFSLMITLFPFCAELIIVVTLQNKDFMISLNNNSKLNEPYTELKH